MSNAMIAVASLYHDPRFFNQSEIRIRNNKIVRQRELRKHLLIFAIILFSISFILVFWRMGLMSDAHTEDQAISYKYYKSVSVAYGDSLWDIAKENISYDHYKDINIYLDEVRSINHLSDNNINAGSNLIIPYYSDKFVQ